MGGKPIVLKLKAMKPIIGAFEGVDGGDGFVELSRHYFAEEERFIQQKVSLKDAAAAALSANTKQLRIECKHILNR